MKEKIRHYVFLLLIPTAVSIGYCFFRNRENTKMIEIDPSTIIVALITALTSMIGIIVVEICGWRKTLNKMKHYEEIIGVDKNRVCLSQQHEDMEKSILSKTGEVKTILNSELNTANTKLEGLYYKMKKDEEAEKINKAVLSASGRSADEFMNDTKSFFQLYADEIKKSAALSAQIEKLEKQNAALSASNANLQNKINKFTLQNDELNKKIEKLNIELHRETEAQESGLDIKNSVNMEM